MRYRSIDKKSGHCQYCGKKAPLISQSLGLCLNCIREDFSNVLPTIEEAHRNARSSFNLLKQPPRDEEVIKCQPCVNRCRISPNTASYCGLCINKERRLVGATANKGNVSWYYDPLPTNCVAAWACPAGTGAGYPEYAYSRGVEYGYKNSTVFYQACSFDCLFCQNWN
jgi:pyruvate formate lyase activating enzyme